VRVLYTRSRDHQDVWLDDIVVEKGERLEKSVEFSAGQLSVSVTVGGRPLSGSAALVEVLSPDGRSVIASFVAGEVAILRAGTYDVRVALVTEAQEKSVQWRRSVGVSAGLLAKQVVAFRQGQVIVAAVNAGKSLPAEAVALSVYHAGDQQEEVVERGLAGVPITLATGHYDIKATLSASSDAATRWIRDVVVSDERTVERTIEFSAGTALVRAFIAGAGELDNYQAYVYFYKVGDHQQSVAYVPAGEPVLLTAGSYDIRAHFFRSHDQPDIWKREIRIRAGDAAAETVYFSSGTLLIRAFAQGNTELIGDNVFLFVYRSGETGTPVARARSGEGVILSAGTYDVRAVDSRGPSAERWLKDLTVESGKTRQSAVTF
jgi:hypothetical protein